MFSRPGLDDQCFRLMAKALRQPAATQGTDAMPHAAPSFSPKTDNQKLLDPLSRPDGGSAPWLVPLSDPSDATSGTADVLSTQDVSLPDWGTAGKAPALMPSVPGPSSSTCLLYTSDAADE